MIYDLLLTGTGGQGVLTAASVILVAAMKEGYIVRQSEVHGMAQRGGSVTAQIRISDSDIASDLISLKSADMLIGFEVLETVRCLPWLSSDGVVVTTATTVRNFSGYPEIKQIADRLGTVSHGIVVPLNNAAGKNSSGNNYNMFVLGVAAKVITVISMHAFTKAVEEVLAERNLATITSNRTLFEQGYGMKIRPKPLSGIKSSQ